MYSKSKYLSIIAVATLISESVLSQEPIEPLMVTIPGGSFEMGSLDAEHTKPVHTVTLQTFSMGKYEVTVREFREFIEATNYPMPQECRHEVDDWMKPYSKGSWDNNFPTTNEFMPVVCVGWKGANAYAEWLAETTGKPYRLPSEAEWEYAALGGAKTKFHFGDDSKETEMCTYANTADLAGENILQRTTNSSYVNFGGGFFNCVDHAGYASIVGMYQPNQYGLHNMIGNVFEFVADCYFPNYEGAPTDGSARIGGACEQHSARGSSWHWKADPLTSRMGFDDFVGGIEGFRLALDGEAPQKTKATTKFEQGLVRAQKREQNRRDIVPEYPETVQNLQIEQSNQYVTLTWEPAKGEGLHTYRVYRNRYKGGRYRLLADNLVKPQFKDANFEPHIYQYRVVAVRDHLQGDYSNIVETSSGWLRLTNRLEAEHYARVSGAAASWANDESRIADGLSGRDGIGKDAVASYQVDIIEAGSYKLTYRVASPRDGAGFEVWLDGKKLVTNKVASTGGYWDWSTQGDAVISLPTGRHEMQVKSLDNNWKLNWLGFEKTKP
ncbi:MAG: SUMF1/EgtB/PvdO family nonheme iron enzyme [Kordiimonas sp.]